MMRLIITPKGLGATLLPPVTGTISSPFGTRAAPVAGASTNHQGIDYAVPIGTPVEAATNGTVIYSGVQSGFGNVIQIDNGNGVVTTYGHLSSLGAEVGQTVSAGDQIALSGATGTVTGPNLHFQVSVDGVNVDPQTLLADTGMVADTGTGSGATDGSGGGDYTTAAALDPVTVGLALAAGVVVLMMVRS